MQLPSSPAEAFRGELSVPAADACAYVEADKKKLAMFQFTILVFLSWSYELCFNYRSYDYITCDNTAEQHRVFSLYSPV